MIVHEIDVNFSFVKDNNDKWNTMEPREVHWALLAATKYWQWHKFNNNLTYTDVLAINEELRNVDLVWLHPISDFLLVHMAHEDVPLLELHHESLEDFLYCLAFGISRPDDAHAGEIQNDLSAVFIFVVLQTKRKERMNVQIDSRLVEQFR
jgi:hypothetical protein